MGNRVSDVAVPTAADELAAIGDRVGAIVRADVGDAHVIAALLTGHGVPVLTLNVAVVGTDDQERIIVWAVTCVCSGRPGFHLYRAT